ncbi:MAG: DUF1972 domain-containing protein [Candidatus Phosphoribacter sp.]|nr:DUF1972 domain-containing protein [Actinomycetales bacterium]
MTVRTVRILGTRGVPAAHGGFETAAEHVGLHLHRQGWRVLVYCQIPGQGPIEVDEWRGLERVNIREPREGSLGTAFFDRKCVAHVLREAGPNDVCLTFGYNTGVFNIAQRVKRIPNVINMDGMEWLRRRWGPLRRGILLGNERVAGLVGDILIADHPHIATYLRRHFGSRRVVTIAYGAHAVHDAPTAPVEALGLEPGRYATLIARPILENSILEIVQAWSACPRPMSLAVLGALRDDDPYHREVRAAAGDQVRFLGAIYDPDIVAALRFHSALYLHGHTVGGTNPSLVEAMAAGNAVIAHNNPYNRFVAGVGNRYFDAAEDLAQSLDLLLEDRDSLTAMGRFSRMRHETEYTWEQICDQYEKALLRAMRARGIDA